MAGASFLALLDDIATILDDVAVMSKTAASKTAGVVGDDLALNAQQVLGTPAERELPLVYAVAKGSMLNKLIIVPTALLISFTIPWLILPLLMLGGGYLCLEGVEKLHEKFFHKEEEEKGHAEHREHLKAENPVDAERTKIKGAIRTDFVLSAEIIVIALGVVASKPIAVQAIVLTLIAVAMTVGVYGLVALIVKLDDIGFYLERQTSKVNQRLGMLLVLGAPKLMKTLMVVGTAAMFVVGGSIIAHGVAPVHHFFEGLASASPRGTGWLVDAVANAGFGILAGILILTSIETGKTIYRKILH